MADNGLVDSKKRKLEGEGEEQVNTTPLEQPELKKAKTDGPAGRPGDWSCPKCSHHNYAFRDICQKCKSGKDGKESSSNLKHPGDWLCPNCAHHNYASRVACQRCSTGKPGAHSAGKHPGDWNCIQCGDLNYASRIACRKCSTPKPPAFGGRLGFPGLGLGGFGGLGSGFGAGPSYGASGVSGVSGVSGMSGGAGMSGFGAGNGYASAGSSSGGMGFGAGAGYGTTSGSGVSGLSGMAGGAGLGLAALSGLGLGLGLGGMNHSPAPGGSHPGDWACPSCNDINYASRLVCRKCNTPKASAPGHSGLIQGRPGDWLCPSCKDHNYASRSTCRKCNTHKSDEGIQAFKLATVGVSPSGTSSAGSVAGGKHPGDWNCTSCYHLNYASRTACRLCNTPKFGNA